MANDRPEARPARQRASIVGAAWKPLGVVAIVLVVVNLLGFDPIGNLRDRLFGGTSRPEAAGTTLLTIRRTTELRAATGEFSVPVYFGTEQSGVVHDILPDAFDANSGVAIYQGGVDAFVDLRSVTGDDLEINRTDRTIVITVPEPRLSEPNIDEAKSKVITQDRGLMTRLGELFSDTPLKGKDELDRVAVRELAAAAKESGLTETARDNTRDFLTALAKRLGYDEVDVKFRPATRE
ncbi:MAG: DUF4230 domain-containing protein [Acidimicrobiales bacterium]